MKSHIVIVVFAICWCQTQLVNAQPKEHSECDWLISKHLEIYSSLLVETGVSAPLNARLKENFHRFAFEWWLDARRTKAKSVLRWRGYFRQYLHGSAKSEKNFSDPLGLLPFFKNGELPITLGLAPVRGLDLNTLTETKYRMLIKQFQCELFDYGTLFSDEPIPNVVVDFSNRKSSAEELSKMIAGKNWRWLRADRLAPPFDTAPASAFRMMNLRARVYYLPAFLRMCEMESAKEKDLPGALILALLDEADQNCLWRALNSDQKCAVTCFLAPFDSDSKLRHLIKKLQAQASNIACGAEP